MVPSSKEDRQGDGDEGGHPPPSFTSQPDMSSSGTVTVHPLHYQYIHYHHHRPPTPNRGSLHSIPTFFVLCVPPCLLSTTSVSNILVSVLWGKEQGTQCMVIIMIIMGVGGGGDLLDELAQRKTGPERPYPNRETGRQCRHGAGGVCFMHCSLMAKRNKGAKNDD